MAVTDGQRALKVVRERAASYHIDTAKIGIMGFSAGGHLAASVSTHFATDHVENKERTDLRPSFSILIYPVISFTDSLVHGGSRAKMLGKDSLNPEKIRLWSNELNVTARTPPAFLLHASDDKAVKPANSIAYYEALQKNGVASELHLIQRGGHGFGLNDSKEPIDMMSMIHAWLKANGFAK